MRRACSMHDNEGVYVQDFGGEARSKKTTTKHGCR
jgi:hypothetical protein